MSGVHAPGWAPHRRAAWLAAALLAACATPPPDADGPVVFSGRLALQVAARPPDGAAQSVSAQFDLAGDARRGRLALSTPLGTRLGEARWAPGVALLVGPGGGQSRYDGTDALTRALLGEALPLAALFDWLAGRPWPAAPSAALPSTPGFAQLGWQIDLARLEAGIIVAHREAPPAVALRVKLDGVDRTD